MSGAGLAFIVDDGVRMGWLPWGLGWTNGVVGAKLKFPRIMTAARILIVPVTLIFVSTKFQFHLEFV